MLTILKSQLPLPEDTIRTLLAEYKQQLADHALTEGVEAPWPKHDILPIIIGGGGDFTVVDDITPAIHEANAQVSSYRKGQFRRKRFTEREPK